MFRFLIIFAALFSTSVFAQATYQEKKTWVTKYLDGGGLLRDITGLVRPRDWKDLAPWNNIRSLTNLPEKFNWNDSYVLQPIRNQRACGSCWAFATTAVTESLYHIAHQSEENVSIDLAEQTLVSSCERAGSCSGGYFSAFNYIQAPGLPDETQDPYLARNSSCKEGLKPVQKVVSWGYVGERGSRPTTEQIKTAIMTYGPVVVDVNGSFGSYGSGVYNRCGNTGTNHMVVLDGWVDDPAYAANGGGYWIMRNSWGKSWGEAGYMNIVFKSTRGSNCNGIGNVTAYAVLEK